MECHFSNTSSGGDHQRVDWVGIHEKICQLLIPLRTPMPFFSSEEERAHRKQQLIMRQVSFQYFCISGLIC